MGIAIKLKSFLLLSLSVIFLSLVLTYIFIALKTETPEDLRSLRPIIGRNHLIYRDIILQAENTKNKLHPKIYIYSWPNEIIDRWPKATTHHRISIEKQFSSNHGAGPIINARKGLHYTHQYTLFPIFHQLLLASEFVTTDAEKADIFFIPYDLGMDSSTRIEDGALTATQCPKVDNVMILLNNSIYFHRNRGKDHLLIHSINHMMRYFANDNCSRLYEMCFNCVKLSIDVYTSEEYKELSSLKKLTNNWISVPFPSNFHLSPVASDLPWVNVFKTSQQYMQQRPYSLCFIGTEEVTALKQRQLRRLIIEACKLFADSCLHIPLLSHSSNVNILSALQSINKSILSENAYEHCRLCLSPGGDFPTRKGFLDAMLSGCIPVTFQLISAQHQWPYHWGSIDNAMRASLYIPRHVAVGNMTREFIKLIQLSNNESFLRDKLKGIETIGHRFQYPLPSYISSIRHADPEEIKGKDAFSIIMSALA